MKKNNLVVVTLFMLTIIIFSISLCIFGEFLGSAKISMSFERDIRSIERELAADPSNEELKENYNNAVDAYHNFQMIDSISHFEANHPIMAVLIVIESLLALLISYFMIIYLSIGILGIEKEPIKCRCRRRKVYLWDMIIGGQKIPEWISQDDRKSLEITRSIFADLVE